MRYLNYEIKQDQFSWSLTMYGKVKDKNSKNFGKEVIIKQLYPHTLASCFQYIRTNILKEKIDNVLIDGLTKSIQESDQKFIADITLLLKQQGLK